VPLIEIGGTLAMYMYCLEKRFYLVLVLAVLLISGTSLGQKAEEIVQRHLDSIGSLEHRLTSTSRLVLGETEFAVVVPESTLKGRALMASDGHDLMFLSNFGVPQYKYEKIGLFDGKSSIPFISQGMRSPLGSYLQVNTKILTERLFGGSILSSWRLLEPGTFEVRNAGKKRINGRDAFVIRLILKNALAGESAIKLYFDAETFQHLRTEYLQTIPDKDVQPIRVFGANLGENVNLFVEDFSDYRRTGNLTLPHKYRASLTLSEGKGTKEFRWSFNVEEYKFQKFSEGFFKF